MMKYILGIDVGTSNVKAVLFDECGNEVRRAGRSTAPQTRWSRICFSYGKR